MTLLIQFRPSPNTVLQERPTIMYWHLSYLSPVTGNGREWDRVDQVVCTCCIYSVVPISSWPVSSAEA